MEYDYLLIEKIFTEYILDIAGPSKDQDDYRHEKLEQIKQVIIHAFIKEPDFQIKLFSFGSFPFKSYHRNSDMDISLVLFDKKTDKLKTNYTLEYLDTKVINKIKESLVGFISTYGPDNYVETIEASVRLVKCKFQGVSFDISVNNFVGLFKLVFMHYLETKYLDSYFYKRTLQLIKSWCYYEGIMLGSNISLLGSYALEIIVIYMFNNHYDMFNTELEAFFTFFRIMKQVDWDNQLLTIFGLFDKSLLRSNEFKVENLYKDYKFDSKMKIPQSEIAEYVKQFKRFIGLDKAQNFNVNSKTLITEKVGMYIIDPIYNSNNLAKSVNPHNFSRIKELFNYMANECSCIQKARINNSLTPAEYFNTLLNLYKNLLIENNPELFRLSMPEPKIIIYPSKGNISNESKKEEDGDNINKQFQSFNKQFTIDNNGENVNKEKIEKGNYVPNINNKINGLLWPTNNEISDEQTVINYKINNISNIVYITNGIIDFANKYRMSMGNINNKPYEFKTEEEVKDIEKFEKEVVI